MLLVLILRVQDVSGQDSAKAWPFHGPRLDAGRPSDYQPEESQDTCHVSPEAMVFSVPNLMYS